MLQLLQIYVEMFATIFFKTKFVSDSEPDGENVYERSETPISEQTDDQHLRRQLPTQTRVPTESARAAAATGHLSTRNSPA